MLHLFQENAEMTLKVESRSLAMAQFNRQYHFLLVVCSKHVSVLYRFEDIQRRITACPWKCWL